MVTAKPIYSFYYLRIFACIGIVLLHTLNGAIGLYGSTIPLNAYLVSQSVLNLLLWCVPCFVMVTGALLLNPKKEISYHKLFKKYILRIIYALLFCCTIFTIFDFVVHQENLTFLLLMDIIGDFFTGTSWSHLWYLYLIIGIYLMLPLYRLVVKGASEKDIKYALGLYLLFLSIVPMFSAFGLNISFYILSSTIYPFYVFFGYAYCKNIISLRKRQSIILIMISSIALVLVTVYQVAFGFSSFESLTNYSSIFVVLQSIGIFSLCFNIKKEPNKVIKSLDSNSFGIYLIHMIFVRLLLKYMHINPYNFVAILSFLGLVIFIFVLSYLFVMILKKIPGIKSFI